MKEYPYAAFSGYGLELEYMIVDREGLNVLAIADQLLDLVGGADDMDVARGEAAWSNELALHVIEMKSAGPIADLQQARAIFRREVDALNDMLVPFNARLMPTGMHPWMNPALETRLWPHQNNEIYSSFDRIFSCQGHGWSNLQSMHINFPFQSEADFGKLHAACRVTLPLLPALAASSPFWNGQQAPQRDQRLAVYRDNCARVPSVTGQVIPEAVFSEADYQRLLEAMYHDISPFDPEGILQEEWLNARGAIARFDRGAIEIRVIDTQECPEQDMAVAYVVTELMHALYRGTFAGQDELRRWSSPELVHVFDACVLSAEEALIPSSYAAIFGSQAQTAQELWSHLVCELVPSTSSHRAALELILEQGSLATRLLRGQQRGLSLQQQYRALCDCLQTGRPYAL